MNWVVNSAALHSSKPTVPGIPGGPLRVLVGSRSSDAVIARKNALLYRGRIEWRKSVEQVAVRYHVIGIPDVQRAL